MCDSVKVELLIMVTLQSRMEHCTDILKTFFANLVVRFMDGKSHPKLIFGKTECLAE